MKKTCILGIIKAVSRGGGIGRRAALRWLWALAYAGSSPALGTILRQAQDGTGCSLAAKAPRLGRGDRRFESGHPDHLSIKAPVGLFCAVT